MFEEENYHYTLQEEMLYTSNPAVYWKARKNYLYNIGELFCNRCNKKACHGWRLHQRPDRYKSERKGRC